MNDQNRRKRKPENIDYLNGYIPPQSRDLEEVILGALMIDPSAVPLALEIIKSSQCFYVDAHKHIYDAITSLYDLQQPVDTLTVVEQLMKVERLDMVGGPTYVLKLTNAVVSGAHIEHHCRIVLEKFLSREIIKISMESTREAYQDFTDPFDLCDKMDDQLIKARELVMSGASNNVKSTAKKVVDEYYKTKQTGILGLLTGIRSFDNTFSGLCEPDLFIVAARPGAGKTAFALSITKNICIDRGIPMAWFSLEMSETQLVRRLISIDTNINHEFIRKGTLDSEQEILFLESSERVAEAPLFIEDNSNQNIRSLRTRAHLLKRKNPKLGVIVVDYMQLMSPVQSTGGAAKNREQDVSEISRGLKNLSKELKVPIVALSQLSRAVEARADKMPQLSDLRESGSIEQDADEVLFLMRPEYYGMLEPVDIGGCTYDVKGLCIGKTGKNRHGAVENFAMHFEGPCMKFSDVKTVLIEPSTTSGDLPPYEPMKELPF